ncbi:nucleoporin Nup188 [Cylas formicarius]|uniref:nucleoporin Nup188 n=1 Tax=Cylas formicarius TaxID=197179 RepID=UPI002958C491|nr:nucleoporin Nup188 [Cylas formicarius]
MTENDTQPVWKKFYQILSVSHQNVTSDLVEDVLDLCKKKLVSGLLEYKQYTKEGFTEWKELYKKMSISQDDEMCSFIHRLSKELDLHSNIAWYIICNFLIFDYYGKVDELKSIIKYETNVKSLIDHIWYFYSSDRMFMLKTLRYILENLSEKDHMLYNQFNHFINSINIEHLWKNLCESFEMLTTEISKDKATRVSKDTLSHWIRRNNREQVEILLLMIQVIDIIKLDGKEIIHLLKLFMRHGFGRHPLFYGASYMLRAKDMADIKAAEIGVILAIIHRYWQQSDLCKIIPKQLETDLEIQQTHGDNVAVLFIWLTFKSTLSKDFFNSCNNAIDVLVEKKVFKTLSDVLKSEIFEDCKCAEIILEATNKLMTEFVKVCGNVRLIYEQDGVVDILCELMKKPNLHALSNFSQYFEASLNIFPYIMNHFLNICSALIENEKCYDMILKLLHTMPSYCSEFMWVYTSDMIVTVQATNLFNETDRFVMPPHTTAERSSCYGKDVIKFNYKYDLFDMIDQYIISLSNWVLGKACYNKLLLSYVIQGTTFLTHLIKFYQGDFNKETIIKPILHRLDGILTNHSNGSMRNLELFYAYFEAKCALVMKQNVEFAVAFPQTVKKIIFPTISDYQNGNREMTLIHINTDCILYIYLKDEENTNDHKLLLLYLDLVANILEKNILHKEVIYPGIWFVVNVVYPLHQQWKYSDSHQQAKVLKGCLSIFIRALRVVSLEGKREDAEEIYEFTLKNLLNNDCIVSIFCSHFIKDKFYLQNIMNEESNWFKGPSLVYIENIRLQLVILLLLYKFKITQTNIKFYIDHKTHMLSKAACAYFVNAYSCPIALLSCKFLEILARDENVPLMACLGLDGDQLQILFLDQLRDPMQDEAIKLNILNLLSTCIFYQNGMTAALFNVQCSKKWYIDSKTKQLDGDTLGDFMIDYLENIKKSVQYLKNPLQLGVLKVMANLWLTGKQHLIKDVTALDSFWLLLADPLFRKLDQTPGVYAYILKIFSIELGASLQNPEGHEKFFAVVEKFLTDKKTLEQLQKYMFDMFPSHYIEHENLEEQDVFIKSWTEVMVAARKQKKIKVFSTEDIKYLFVSGAFDGIKSASINMKLWNSWLEYCLIVIDLFGFEFSEKQMELVAKSKQLCSVVRSKYINSGIKERRTALTIIFKIIKDFKEYYETSKTDLQYLLEEIGFMMDYEYSLLEDVWSNDKEDPNSVNDESGVWALIMLISNYILSYESVKDCQLWFTCRKYLTKLLNCTCDLLGCNYTLAIGKLALHGLLTYIKSPLYMDFLKVNLNPFYNSIHPVMTKLLNNPNLKLNPKSLKEGWIIFTLVLKLHQIYVQKFKIDALETCYSFLILNEKILEHIMTLPETTVDIKALDLLIQTLKFYDTMITNWKTDWSTKYCCTFNFMIGSVRKMINSCIYICLKPKHIAFYYMDKYNRIIPVNQDSTTNHNLMIVSLNRLIGVLGIAFTCLFNLNHSLVDMFDLYQTKEPQIILIENDFSVPQFEMPIPNDLNYGKLLCLAHFLCKTLNQVYQKKGISQGQNIDEKYLDYICVVEHQDSSEYRPNQKLSFFLRHTMYEYSGLIDSWTENLSAVAVQKTLEVLMAFIGQQTFISVGVLDPIKVAYFKTNLCSELQFFNEYVKKKTSLLFDKPPNTKSMSSYKSDMDIVKRYLIYHWKNNKQDEVAENNFLLILSFWFSNICLIQ